ncbi:DUF308 domain-containing protein [Sphingomonas sp. H39-1-10]|uniref:HdeD family acid-resistance protein n=1 Tax=Sphingomonas pollutisoli TaxID=3030829 RepID=UPI0023B8E9C8|nr:DUF308 domain-containing protein [Sphingomonas pollutisoli]MDF0488368.1 DUF308 domain-containing protein [Sphingomonas pollutisoli]
MATHAFEAQLRVKSLDTESWGWFVGTGAALALLGFIASANLLLAAIAATYVVGAAMFAGGILMLVHAFGVRRWGWAAFWALSGLLYLSAAAAVLYQPLLAAGLIVLVLAASIGASGLVRVGVALGARGHGWGWMLASGLISIAAAVLIAIGWPANAIWVLGFILAIDLLFQGSMLMLVGFTLRSQRTT